MTDMNGDELAGYMIDESWPEVARTNQDFAKHVGTSVATLQKIYKGYMAARPSTYIAIERALGWPLGSIKAIRAHNLEWLTAKNFPPDAMERLTEALAERTDKQETA